MVKFGFLWTDILFFFMLISGIILFLLSLKKPNLKRSWKGVFNKPIVVISAVFLFCFLMVASLDSIHFHKLLSNTQNGDSVYTTKLYSVLDQVFYKISNKHEKSYSKPFALKSYTKEFVKNKDGILEYKYMRLKHAGIGIKSLHDKHINILYLLCKSMIYSFLIALTLYLLFMRNKSVKLKVAFITSMVVLALVILTYQLGLNYHIFGTDKVGQDVFYLTIKSIRTGIIIGTLSTLFMIPFALMLGISAGFFGGIVDDIIQYVYTTLSSIPSVLLIAASILSMQIYIANHPEYFTSLASRADLRLLSLCFILGITSWTSLCRMLRAETLKLRESDFICAAHVLGTRKSKIIVKHILPNVMHIVIIACVLDFSFLVLAEAVLSYVGVGVSPTTISWGNMINSARLELARDPVVWWPMLAAFSFMFLLVLSSNVFSDGVRDAFDPRIK